MAMFKKAEKEAPKEEAKVVEKEIPQQQDLPLEDKATEGKELAPVEGKSVGAAQMDDGFVNPFEEVGRQANRRIVGELLKFSKGDYMFGKDNHEVPMGTKMICNMEQMLRGWIRWEENKPAEQIMGSVIEGHKLQKRDTLGYTDQDEWEIDETSKEPKDPWQETYYLVMRQLDKDNKPMEGSEGLFTFTTSSTGGKDAMIELCAQVGKWMRVHSMVENGKLVMKDFPVVSLGVEKYNHPNKAYGVIKKPKLLFRPKTDWIAKDKFGDIVEAPVDDGEDIPF